MEQHMLWRPFNFKVPILREFVMDTTLKYIKNYIVDSAHLEWIEGGIYEVYERTRKKWNLFVDAEYSNQIMSSLKNNDIVSFVCSVSIVNDDKVIEEIPVFVHKKIRIVEFYYPDSKIFLESMGKRLITDFTKYFTSITPSFKYITNIADKEPELIIEMMQATEPELFQNLYIAPEFCSFNFLWYLFVLHTTRLQKSNYNLKQINLIYNWTLLSNDDKVIWTNEFGKYIMAYGNYLWNELPDACRNIIDSTFSISEDVLKESFDFTELLKSCPESERQRFSESLEGYDTFEEFMDIVDDLQCSIESDTLYYLLFNRNKSELFFYQDTIKKLLDERSVIALTLIQLQFFTSTDCRNCIQDTNKLGLLRESVRNEYDEIRKLKKLQR